MGNRRIVFLFIMSLLFFTGAIASSEQQVITVQARLFNYSLEGIHLARDGSIPYPYLGFVFDNRNCLFLSTESGSSSFFCVFSPNFAKYELIKKRTPEISSVFRVGDGVSVSFFGVGILANIDGEYDFVGPVRDPRYRNYYYANSQLLVFGDGIQGQGLHVNYIGYVLGESNFKKILKDDEFRVYIKEHETGFSIVNNMLCYRGREIEPICDLVDDSGNWYEGSSVLIDHMPIKVMDTRYDEMIPVNQANRSWDAEGNLWYLVYPKNEGDSAKLMYVGRDWGYRDSPKKAVCTSDNLRIRLRATTEAFVLGKLMNNQPITILMTGGMATIDGMTAPWYRIKTADGLIGWAWGGYIKVIEK